MKVVESAEPSQDVGVTNESVLDVFSVENGDRDAGDTK